jgi:hypothetical protein
MWHEAGYTQCVGRGLQPTPHFESAESKRRLHNLLDVTGTLDTLARVRARAASRAELARVHSEAYIDYIVGLSEDTSKGCHHAGDCLSISPGGFDIAARAAGAAIRLVDTVLGQEEGPGACGRRGTTRRATRAWGEWRRWAGGRALGSPSQLGHISLPGCHSLAVIQQRPTALSSPPPSTHPSIPPASACSTMSPSPRHTRSRRAA